MLEESKDQSVAQELIGNTNSLGKVIERTLSCRMCKKRHDAIILHAIGWACWRNCASKSEQRLIAGSGEQAQVSMSLVNLAMCLSISGHRAEAREVEQTIRSFIDRLKISY